MRMPRPLRPDCHSDDLAAFANSATSVVRCMATPKTLVLIKAQQQRVDVQHAKAHVRIQAERELDATEPHHLHTGLRQQGGRLSCRRTLRGGGEGMEGLHQADWCSVNDRQRSGPDLLV